MRIAIAMVRDEADILPYTLPHMLAQVDHAIIADNGSRDGTRAVIKAFGNVTVVDDPDPAYYQADKMTRLAHMAGDRGADWVIPFDADEAWFLPADLEDIAADVVRTYPFVYVPRHNPPGDPITCWQWRQEAHEPHPKIAFRYRPDVFIEMGNHDVVHPGDRIVAGQMRHYQWRSLDQVRRKVHNGVSAYSHTNMGDEQGTHWKNLAKLSDQQLEEWWDNYINQPLIYDP